MRGSRSALWQAESTSASVTEQTRQRSCVRIRSGASRVRRGTSRSYRLWSADRAARTRASISADGREESKVRACMTTGSARTSAG